MHRDPPASLRPAVFALTGCWCSVAIVAAAALVSLRGAERWAIATAEAVLTRGLAQRVSVARLGVGVGPALVLHDVRVGDALAAERIDVVLSRGGWPGLPRLELLRVSHPVVLLDERTVARLQTRAERAAPRRPGGTQRRAWPRVEVIDATLRGRVAVGASHLDLEARGVHFDTARARLITGPVRIAHAGRPLVDLAATALDLQPRTLWPPTKGAILGGRLYLGSARAAIAIQHGVLRREGHAYVATLTARTGGRDPGAMHVRARIAEARADPVELHLDDVALTSFGPAAERWGVRLDAARASGKLVLRGGAERVELSGTLAVQQLGLAHEWVASAPIEGADLELSGSAIFLPNEQNLRIEEMRLRSAGVEMRLSGEVTGRADGHARIAAALELPATECQQVLAALPAGFAPALQGLALRGDFGARAALRFDTAALAEARVSLSLQPQRCTVLADSPHAPVLGLLARNVAVQAMDGRGRMQPWVVGPANPAFRTLRRVAPSIRAAFVASEDSNFYRHSGFDTLQLERAFVANLQAGRLVRGASTVSMQLAKNLFLDHRRTASRKLQEIVLTWRMEQVLSKERILELYLNVVEMGPGIRGVEQACQHYFGHGADRATPLEAAHLAALAPSPRPLAARFAKGDPGPTWRSKLQQLLRIMRRRGSISAAGFDRWSRAELILKPQPREE